ncbi:PQQ-binding-like beta-propeller repeat protein [Micromonospora sp. WMMD1155]|uniref:outer membrane protein assembly factor BamB family protein n=1 Tax=Micromonospora sp. WMMD1155 TaxID=3016094 RepID=UPI00249AF52F|nr:PQQ-binding-like beta-propeller repeat protein [Micromonospora sp. WMMD1155]WFE49609.1 PQQ-binding-like beta-propeller repeat protein [Micromonospora sp. WMMD1155]
MTEGRLLSIIELGEVRDEASSTPTVRRPRAAGRPLRSVAVLVLALVLLAAATPVPQQVVSVVPAVRTSTAYLGGDSVFVVDPPAPEGERYLTAYAQPSRTGAGVHRRWQAPLARLGDYLDVRVEQGLVLAMAVNDDGVFETTAYDSATGQRRWQHPGGPQPIAQGGLLLTENRGDREGAMGRVDPGTGRVLWSMSIPAPSNPAYHRRDGQIDQFVLLQPTGEVQVYDAGTGRLLRGIDTLPGDRAAYQRVWVVDDLLLLVPPGSTRLIAYRLAYLQPLWTAEVPLISFVFACADLLCAVPQTGGLQVLDPATGVVRWSDSGPNNLADVRHGQLLMARPGRGYEVWDAATGRVRTELGPWALMQVLGPDAPLVGTRSGDDGRMVVAELDLVAHRARIVDVLPAIAGSCQASLPMLLCQRLDGTTALWRLTR